jgi:hypothetical protein
MARKRKFPPGERFVELAYQVTRCVHDGERDLARGAQGGRRCFVFFGTTKPDTRIFRTGARFRAPTKGQHGLSPFDALTLAQGGPGVSTP